MRCGVCSSLVVLRGVQCQLLHVRVVAAVSQRVLLLSAQPDWNAFLTSISLVCFVVFECLESRSDCACDFLYLTF